MSSVCSSSSLGSSVDLDVLDGEVFEVLGVGVGLQVVDQTENNSDGLFRPSTKSLAEFLSLTGSSDTTEVFQIWDTSSVGQNVLEVLLGFGNGETLDGICGLVCVFIMDSEILS